MLYMLDRYGVAIRMDREALVAWDEADPPLAWEVERARRIESLTALHNPLIRTR